MEHEFQVLQNTKIIVEKNKIHLYLNCPQGSYWKMAAWLQ